MLAAHSFQYPSMGEMRVDPIKQEMKPTKQAVRHHLISVICFSSIIEYPKTEMEYVTSIFLLTVRNYVAFP